MRFMGPDLIPKGDIADYPPSYRKQAIEKALALPPLTADYIPHAPPSANGVTPQQAHNHGTESEWQRIANYCADLLRGRFRFENERRAWWQWTDNTHWRQIEDLTIITDAITNRPAAPCCGPGRQGHD